MVEGKIMPYCPECGGEMLYSSQLRQYICKSCGLSLTLQEIIELREKLRRNQEIEEDERKRFRKEYLQWWLSKKSN
ncbi:MAG: hypothetical protein QXH24_00775 [Candidatus Bathyarchaeia archaeon]